MALPTAFASAQTKMALGLETSRGTAATTLFGIPLLQPKYKPDIVYSDDKSFQGVMAEIQNTIRGQRYDGHGWDGYPYLDMFPVLLAAELGSTDTVGAAPTSTTLASSAAQGATTISTIASIAVGQYFSVGSGGTLEGHYCTSVSGAGPFTVTLNAPLAFAQASGAAVTGLTSHSFSLLNNSDPTGQQPPSCTLNDFDGDQWRQITAAQLDMLTIKATATGLVEYTSSWFGNPSVTPSTPSFSYSATDEAPPGWTSQVLLGGTLVQDFVEYQLDFKRGVKPIPAFIGNEAYLQYFAGPIQCTGKITVVNTAGAPELVDYLSNSINAFEVTFFDQATGWSCTLHSTKTKFKTGEIDRTKEWEEATLTMQLLPSSTDATAGARSPVKATVANAQTTAYL